MGLIDLLALLLGRLVGSWIEAHRHDDLHRPRRHPEHAQPVRRVALDQTLGRGVVRLGYAVLYGRRRATAVK